MITAPFNFVPLSDKVFFPDWAKKVSHDEPMTDNENKLDSQSGEIEITIEAKSPIFIRKSYEEGDEYYARLGKRISKEFWHVKDKDKQYYIPSSSIKGMTRSVLEILSFSKMNPETYNDTTYAVRDLSNDKLYLSEFKKDVLCGWLTKDNEKDEYFIQDCGEPGRISHNHLNDIFGFDFASHFRSPHFDDSAEKKTAKYKYGLLEENQNMDNTFKSTPIPNKTKYDKRKAYCYDENGNKGTIVLTGQPSARNTTTEKGKLYEFIFFESKSTYPINVTHLMESFKFSYFDDRKTEPKESPDWAYWKEKLKNNERVPVFFKKMGIGIKHFGLSYLYKLPYNNSVKDGIKGEHNKPLYDLSQLIFGYIDGKKALKGRVQFSHFKAYENINVLRSRSVVLGSPRASYYPIYVRQSKLENGKKDYITFMENFTIAGRKRYPIHNSSNVNETAQTDNDNISTEFMPLNSGVKFRGKLRYHNLKKAELGAILSALTFHNTPNTFHNIGLAKSLGYGKIIINIENFPNLEDYLREFEINVTQKILDWKNSPQITELLTMASEQNNQDDSDLVYMSEPANFADEKQNKNYLKMYSKLTGINAVHVNSLISNEQMQEVKSKHQKTIDEEKTREEEAKRLEKEEKAREKEEKAYKEAIKSKQLDKLKSFEKVYPKNLNLATIKKEIQNIENKQEAEKKEEQRDKLSSRYKEIQKVSDTKKRLAELENFIKSHEEQFANGKNIYNAKQEIEKMNVKLQEKNKASSLDDIINAKDIKAVEMALKKLPKNFQSTPDELEAVKVNIINIFSDNTSKKQKTRLFRKTDIEKLFEKSFVNEIKSALGVG